VHPVQPVSVLVLPRRRVVLADGRDRPHPAVALAEPAALRGGPGQRVILGVTTSVLLVLNDRLISTSPNESATRTRSGPMVNLPRLSDWI
jgi:hypothetical protein